MPTATRPGWNPERVPDGVILPKRVLKKAEEFVGRFAWILLVAAMIAGVVLGYEKLDETGNISHDADVLVYINGNWMTGEYRGCFGVTDAKSGKMLALDCAESQGTIGHELPVTFYGEYPTTNAAILSGKQLWLWRCQRKTDSLTCKIPDQPSS